MAFPTLRLAAAGLAIALAAATALPAAAFDDAQRQEIGKIVREYLLANPEVMLEVQQALESKQKAEQAASQQKALSEQKELIFSSAHQTEIGSADAPITIVEFFDYNCGFCQRALGDMDKLVDTGQVRFVLKEYPILSQQSVEAHKVSIAFERLMPEKAADFHRRLLGAEGRKDGAMALDIGVELGADREALAAESEKPEIVDAIREAHALAEALGITGTPSYVVGEEVVFGAVGFEALKTRVANMEACGKVTC